MGSEGAKSTPATIRRRNWSAGATDPFGWRPRRPGCDNPDAGQITALNEPRARGAWLLPQGKGEPRRTILDPASRQTSPSFDRGASNLRRTAQLWPFVRAGVRAAIRRG
jgi:hypothetical protein